MAMSENAFDADGNDAAGGRRSPAPAPAPPVRLLHIEADPREGERLRSVLEQEGMRCRIFRVTDRAELATALESSEFDAAVCEIVLPRLRGIDALRMVRASLSDLPFLFLSGAAAEEAMIEGLKAGATDYVLKEKPSLFVPRLQKALADARDRAEQKRTERELRESENRYRSIVETTNEWIWESNAEGRLTFCNPAVLALVGYRPEELVGASGIEYLHPEDAAAVPAVVEKAIAEKSGWTGWVLRWRQKDGSYRFLESNAVAVFGASGEFQGFRGATRDITERLEIEAQLRQTQKIEAIGTLAGGIAHDFNNILTTVLGYTDLLRQSLDPDHPLRPDVEEIQKAAERASALTRQLLAFSRKQVLTPVVLDLNAVISEVEKMLRRLIGENIRLETELDPDVAPVRADASQIEQVILNLAINARDAMPSGGRLGIRTRALDLDDSYIRRREYSARGPHVLLSVSDNGVGMDEATRSRIFEPFFTTKGPGKGTGLGLSTVYGIIKQSGGHIEVSSTPGRGTTFRIYLPAVPDEDARLSSASAESVVQRGTETILLVEDEHPVRQLTRRILEDYGYRVLEATGADEAVSLASRYEGPLDLLLTDVVMPGTSGPELARLLAPRRPEMRVLYVSGYTDDAIVRGGALKANEAFLEKPFRADVLTRKIRSVLDSEA